MPFKVYNSYGYIEYDEEVLSSIAGAATMECYGVVGMASRTASDGFWSILKRENLNKGVKISSQNEEINIDLFIIVEYGTKISVIANNIIQKVKYAIESMSDIKINNVIVNVQGIRA